MRPDEETGLPLDTQCPSCAETCPGKPEFCLRCGRRLRACAFEWSWGVFVFLVLAMPFAFVGLCSASVVSQGGRGDWDFRPEATAIGIVALFIMSLLIIGAIAAGLRR